MFGHVQGRHTQEGGRGERGDPQLLGRPGDPLLIIEALGERPLRFSELRNEVEGISHKMLTQNLRMLERKGLIGRTVYPVVPPRVEYALTEPGQALRVTIDGLCDRTHRYLGHIEAARHRTDTAEAGR
ncbi:winged helix-turn-helix transcriptional regulator [Streptomyces erythrochromogenes]|uniref:winged helix-turn-helix transcriptional regulator n=1 Tax=Streptomyces erythrochromogenes TaxID=285574 RepID=UPI00031C45D2